MENLLRNAGLLSRYSPLDILEQYSKVYLVRSGGREAMTEVPKKVRELDARLGPDLISISRDKLSLGLCSQLSHRSCHLSLIPRPIFSFLRLRNYDIMTDIVSGVVNMRVIRGSISQQTI
ncbi:MAG: hypothetical protein JRN10_06420 [Nitrososphaerota archaeon]|jgi:hypothetical protein|nr:hypothetical protein [Nitrososphaerota archaeon]MDG6930857.1 hypothetical protein [Nitrososphaerota archaeon]